MQTAIAEDERAKPIRTECELVAQDKIEIIVVSRCAGRRKSGLLNEGIVRDVAVGGGAKEPLRTVALIPVEANQAKVIAKWNRNAAGNGNGRDRCVADCQQALRGQLGQGIELSLTLPTVSNAGVFVDVFERGEKPELVFDNRSAECADIVLARERLLRIGRGIFDGEASVKRSGTLVESFIAVPLVRAVLGGDHDGASSGAARVGVFLSRSNGKFLNGFRRKILEEAADPVV